MHKMSMESSELIDRFKKILPFISVEEARYYLNGVCFEQKAGEDELRLIATNGHIMQIQRIKEAVIGEGDLRVILSHTAINHLVRILTPKNSLIDIEITAKHMKFTDKDFVYTTQLIDGLFPDYTAVIPKNQKPARIGFNPKYLAATLEALKGETIDILSGTYDNSPHIFVLPGSREIECVIMPRRND